MDIKRKVFSKVSIDGELRLFSTTEVQKEEPKNNRIPLDNIKSKRGIGRSFLIGNAGGLIGRYAGRDKANDLDSQGKSDKEIIKESSKHGAKVGAASGAILGASESLPSLALSDMSSGKKLAWLLANSATQGAAGAGGGYLGAKKHTKVRLKKRRDLVK